MQRIVVLNPTAGPPPPEALGRRLDTLRDKRVGFFSNNKPNADVLLERTAEGLRARFGIEALFFTKEVPSLEADDDLLRECGDACDAVVLAAYD
jgi:hypothetical protein